MRLLDATALSQTGRFDGAYYLFGLAVECGLKACISRKTRRYDFPDKDLAQKSYQHDLSKLVEAAGLGAALNAEINSDAEFTANWLTTKDWSIESRYSIPGQLKAEGLERAVNDRRHGVMRWIRQHW
jgi:hypothetical protein